MTIPRKQGLHYGRGSRNAIKSSVNRLVLAVVLFVLLAANAVAKTKEKVLYRFNGGADGTPFSSLVMDGAGNLYGMTLDGGNLSQCGGVGCGTVFRLTPSAHGLWHKTVLYVFQGGPDGYQPNGGPVFDASGNLFGTSLRGGDTAACSSYGGCGTFFVLSPGSRGKWTKTLLHDFENQSDGAFPDGQLVADSAGNIYGTTYGDTIRDAGSAYELSPTVVGRWKFVALHTFSGSDGSRPTGLIRDGLGYLFGTAMCSTSCQQGLVYEISPPKQKGGQWRETELYGFLGGGNGGSPTSGTIRDRRANMYGTLSSGGNGYGAAFELMPSGRNWKEKMIYNFCTRNYCADGAIPQGGMVLGVNGVLYGTTQAGGTGCNGQGCGVVFSLNYAPHGWQETILYRFKGGSDGFAPQQNLIIDRKGNLYGITGGQYTSPPQVVFEVTP